MDINFPTYCSIKTIITVKNDLNDTVHLIHNILKLGQNLFIVDQIKSKVIPIIFSFHK